MITIVIIIMILMINPTKGSIVKAAVFCAAERTLYRGTFPELSR